MDISSLSVDRIKELVDRAPELPEELLAAMEADTRSAVRALLRRCLLARQKREARRRRAANMRAFELGLREPHHHLVSGVDEAGRGPLAGPVVAAAVILPEDFFCEELDDSKKMSPARREALSAAIKRRALDWSVGMATVAEIDSYNIHHAAMLAMERALRNLRLEPDLVLVDGKFTLPGVEAEQKAVVGGDGLCPSIAAASVVAKETRDRLMNVLHVLYPQYGFDRHKGYGTASHLASLAAFGPSPVHRCSFMPVKQLMK